MYVLCRRLKITDILRCRVSGYIKIDEVEHCDWQDVRLSKIWNCMHSERQKVDQVNSSLLEYKNFF